METHRQLIISLMLLTLLPQGVSAYALSTHEGLTANMMKAYEEWRGEVLSNTEAEAIIRGSIAEDDGTRPLNHFFDPINNRGLTIGTELGQASKRWVQDTLSQANYCDATSIICRLTGSRLGKDDTYFSSPTDYSWERAIYEYAWGDKMRALESLGHVLHILEDKTVPAHVRNDQHLTYGGYSDSDPYEEYTSQFDRSTVPMPANIKVSRHANLDTYLQKVAEYTNTTFVSKDTFFQRFSLPTINALGTSGSFLVDGDKNKIAHIKTDRDEFGRKSDVVVQDDVYNSVVSSNFTTLSKIAIQNGVGIIDLFFRSVEVEKQTLALKQKNISENERLTLARLIAHPETIAFFRGKSALDPELLDLRQTASAAGALAPTTPTVTLTEEAPVTITLSNPTPLTITPTIVAREPVIPESTQVTLEIPTETLIIETLQPSPTPVTITPTLTTEPAPLPAWQQFLTSVIPGFGGGGVGTSVVTATPVVTSASSVTTPTDTTAPDAPIITSVLFFATTSTTVTGTAETDSLVTLSNGATTTASGGTFSFVLTLSDGIHPTTITATDAAGNTSVAHAFDISVFLLPPNAPTLTVTDCASSITTSSCLMPTNTVTLSWDSPTRATSFVVTTNGRTLPTLSSTTTTITIPYDATTTLSVAAIDGAGNSSTSSNTIIVRATENPLIINEVAWAGTTASSSDQWIELYNRSSVALNLSRFVLTSESGMTQLLSGTLAPNSYYVIERSALATSYPHDLSSSFQSFAPTGDQLRLIWIHSGTTTVDTTPNVGTCSGWCAGGLLQTGYSYQYGTTTSTVSMERKPNTLGALASSWHSNDRYFFNRTDRNNNVVYGSPGRENSFNYPDYGWSSSPDAPIVASSTYMPNNFSIYRSAWLGPVTVPRMGGIFKGIVGSSTQVRVNGLGGDHEKSINEQFNLTPLAAGDYFTALWEMPVSGTDFFPTWLRTGIQNGSTNPPHTNVRIVPWIYTP